MVAGEGLADFVDVFCDQGFFTVEDTERILMAGIKHGLRPKIHANEMARSGGIQVGVKYHALSVDHIEYTGDEEIAALKGSDTMPTILPGAAFFLNMPYAPARKIIEAGLPVAMASDYNPGSSPSGNMQLVLSMACVNYRMVAEELPVVCAVRLVASSAPPPVTMMAPEQLPLVSIVEFATFTVVPSPYENIALAWVPLVVTVTSSSSSVAFSVAKTAAFSP